jgi:O-antigen ligase
MFLLLAFVSALQTINVTASTFYMDNLWKVILMATLAAFHLDTAKSITAMIWTIVIAQGYNAYQINLQYFQDGYSMFAVSQWGDNGDNNLYTIITLPILFMSAALCLYSKQLWKKGLAGGIAILQIHQIMLLESRGGMLGGVAGAAVFIVLMPKNRKTIALVSLLTIAGAGLAGPSVVEEFTSVFKEKDELDSSAQSRYKLWKAGYEITADYPLLGVGPYAGQYLVPSYFVDSSRRFENKGLHNLVFEISTGTGVPATFLYLSHFCLIIVGLFKLRRSRRRHSAETQTVILAVLSGQVAYWCASMFSSAALLESTYICSAIGAAVLCVSAADSKSVASQSPVYEHPPQLTPSHSSAI